MNSSSSSSNMATAASSSASMGGFRPPFTASQWQELEHQALIFKYLMAGLPVPPELVIPIKKSFDSISMAMSMSMSASFFHHPTMGYCSFYGKKPDPEPGRCRRTDGKKWRCSKDAYPDSKYCERHMHRGRNRSRKPVETQTIITPSPSSSSSSTLTLTASGSAFAGRGSGSVSFQNLPLHPNTNSPGLGMTTGTNPTHLQMDPLSSGIPTKEYRYLQGMKQEADENSFLSDPCGSARGMGMDTSLESSWRLMPSRVSSFTKSKMRNGPTNQTDYPEMHALQGFGQEPTQQHSFFGAEYGLGEAVKQEGQSLRPFFDEWPKTRGSWSDFEEDRSNPASFSTTTQLSISIPMASSDFSATSSQSPNDD